MKTNRILQDLKKNSLCPIYLVLSNQDFLLEAVTAELRQKLVSPENEAFNLKTFHADSCSARDIITEARTMSLGSGKRLVIVKHVESIGKVDNPRSRTFRKESYELIAGYASNPSPDTCLLMTAAVPLKKDDVL